MDQRSLHRISNQFAIELTAQIWIEGKAYKLTIMDYNSIGVALDVSQELEGVCETKLDCLQVDAIEFFFGIHIIAKFEFPKVIRYSPESKKLVLSMAEKDGQLIKREDVTRYTVPGFQHGTLSGIDPLTMNQALFFRVSEISKSGVKAISSKGNRHLLPGTKFENFDLLLPGVGMSKVDFQLVRVVAGEENLEFGIRILRMDSQFEKALNDYLTLHCDVATMKELKGIEVGSNLKIRRMLNGKEYDDVLALRTLAYQAAGKISADQDEQGMSDEYDSRSIIFCAFLSGKLVATMRLIFSDGESKFPFEKYLEFDFQRFKSRKLCGEISRLAVHPKFQGTDVFIQMFRHIIVEVGTKGIKYPLSLTTSKLMLNYQGIGALIVSKSIPHPTLENETLTLINFDPDRIFDGKMNSLGWFKVAKPAADFLWKYTFVKKPTRGLHHYFLFPFAALGFLVKRANRKRLEKKDRDQVKPKKAA
jgi:hypothetical protein